MASKPTLLIYDRSSIRIFGSSYLHCSGDQNVIGILTYIRYRHSIKVIYTASLANFHWLKSNPIRTLRPPITSYKDGRCVDRGVPSHRYPGCRGFAQKVVDSDSLPRINYQKGTKAMATSCLVSMWALLSSGWLVAKLKHHCAAFVAP